MAKRKKKYDQVIDLLINEKERLINEINSEQGNSKEKIELKEQVIDAIKSLAVCSKHNIFADKIEVFEIPEGGSEAYFTTFHVIDEGGLDNVPDWAIKKNADGSKISLSPFDLVLRTKH